jgi:hypothetical protein
MSEIINYVNSYDGNYPLIYNPLDFKVNSVTNNVSNMTISNNVEDMDINVDTVPIIIMLGQSNCDGRGVTTDMPHFGQYNWQPTITEARGGFTINSSSAIVAYNASLVGAISQFPPVALKKEIPVRIYNKRLTRTPGNTTTNNVINGAWEDYTGLNNVVVSPQTTNLGMGSEIQIAYNWATDIFPNYKKNYI